MPSRANFWSISKDEVFFDKDTNKLRMCTSSPSLCQIKQTLELEMKQKFKVLFMGILFSLFTQSAFAIDLYVGGAAGLGSYDGTYNLRNVTTGTSVDRANTGATTFVGGALLGAEHYFCGDYYVAVELNALYNSLKKNLLHDTNTAGVANHTVRVRNEFLYGADVKLGMNLCGVTPYFVAGVVAARYKMELRNSSGTENFGIPPRLNEKYSRTLVGPKVGIGVRWGFWECLDLDFQYSYTWYDTDKITARLFSSRLQTNYRHSTEHNQHRFLLSINMPFMDLCF